MHDEQVLKRQGVRRLRYTNRRRKLQIPAPNPSSKSQAQTPNKSQISSSKRPQSPTVPFGVWGLELFWRVEFRCRAAQNGLKSRISLLRPEEKCGTNQVRGSAGVVQW